MIPHSPDEAAQVSFSCPRRRGAILSLPMPAQRKDTRARGVFAKCIIEHIDEWFAFVRERGFGISREDIVLVTGCHMTRTWATIVLQEGEQVAFGVRVSGVSDVTWQFTREGAQGAAYNLGPSGQVCLCILFSPQGYWSWFNLLNQSEPTGESVHFH